MRLEKYLELGGESVQRFSERSGVHEQSVYRYKRGERVPNPEATEKIKAATEGAVTANDHHEAHNEWLNAQQARGAA